MISIVIPVCRVSPYLMQSLSSICDSALYAKQRLGVESELVLIANGMSQTQVRYLRHLLSKFDFLRTGLHSLKERGISEALNLGLQESEGDHIARVDDDDFYDVRRLTLQYEKFQADPKLVLLGTNGLKVDSEGHPLKNMIYPLENESIQQGLEIQNCFIHSSVMMKRSAVSEVGGYSSKFDGVEDYHLWVRLAAMGRLANLADSLTFHRRHVNQSSGNGHGQQDQRIKEIMKIQYLNRSNRPTGIFIDLYTRNIISCRYNFYAARLSLVQHNPSKLKFIQLSLRALIINPFDLIRSVMTLFADKSFLNTLQSVIRN